MSAAHEGRIQSSEDLAATISAAVDETPILDVHTHIYSAGFGPLLLWGVDQLITYHYLIAEVARGDTAVSPEALFAMSKGEQADHIWKTLFLDSSPVSEAQRGVLTTLAALGIDISSRDLGAARQYFADVTVEQYIDKVFELANVESVVMTNDPFDEQEHAVWEAGGHDDARFRAALRMDALLLGWDTAVEKLRGWGYEVNPALDADTCAEVRRFLTDWIDRIKAVYMAVSLANTFRFPEDSPCSRIIENCVLPVARDRGLPFAMMIGVKRAVNPALQLAGDSVGKFDVDVLDGMCAGYPDVKFLVTLLSRENQHELCVAARKFPNLMPFGCWWFLNNPSIIEEMTRMRLELLGLSFIPQHSDARILDQLIYKWTHSRAILKRVLLDKYGDAMVAGWPLTRDDIFRDVGRLFSGNFHAFVGS